MAEAPTDWATILKKAGNAIRERRKNEEGGQVAVVVPAVAAPKKSKKSKKAKAVELAPTPQEVEPVAEGVKKEKKDKKKKRKEKSEEVVVASKEKKDKKGKGKAKEVSPVVDAEEVAEAETLARRAARKAEKKRIKAEAKSKKLAKGSPMDTSDEVRFSSSAQEEEELTFHRAQTSPVPVAASPKKKRKRVEEDEPTPIASTSKLPPPSPAAVDSPKPKKRKSNKKAASPVAPAPAPSCAPLDSPQKKKKKRKHEQKEPSPVVAIPSPAPESPAKPKSTRTRKPKAARVIPTPTTPSIDLAAERQRVLDRVVPRIFGELHAASSASAPRAAALPAAEEEIDQLETSEHERPIAPLPKRARRLAEEDPKFPRWAKRFPAAWKALVEQGLLIEVEERRSELGVQEERDEESRRAAKKAKKAARKKAKKEAAPVVEQAASPVVEELVPAIVVEEKKPNATESEDDAPSTSEGTIARTSTPVPRTKPRRRPSQREKEIRAQGSQDESATPSQASRAPSLSPIHASPALAVPSLPKFVPTAVEPVEDAVMADVEPVGGDSSEPETVDDEDESVKEAVVEPKEAQVVVKAPEQAIAIEEESAAEEEVMKDSEIEETDVEEKGKLSASEAGDIEEGEEEEEDELETTPSQLLPARQRLKSREQSTVSSDDDPDELALSLSQHVSKHATPYRPSPLVHSSQVGTDSGDEQPQRAEDESEGEKQDGSSATGSRQSTPIRQDVPSHSQPLLGPLKSTVTPTLTPVVAPIPVNRIPTPAHPAHLQTIGGAGSDSDSSSSDDSDSDDSDSDEEDRPVVAKRSRPSIGALAAEAFGKVPKPRTLVFAGTPAKVASQAMEVDEDFDQLLSQSLPQGVSLSAFLPAEDKEEDDAVSRSSRFSSVATESRETTPAREMRKLAAREVTPEEDATDEDVPAAAPERLEAELTALLPQSSLLELDAPLPNGDAKDVDALPVASTSNGVVNSAPSSPTLAAPAPGQASSSPAKIAASSPVAASQPALNGLSAIADYPASDVGPLATFDLGSTQGDSPGDEEVPLPEESQFVPLVKEKQLFFPETQAEESQTAVASPVSPVRNGASQPGEPSRR